MQGQFIIVLVVVLLLLGLIFFIIYYLIRRDTPNVGSSCSNSSECRGGTTCDPIARVCRMPLRGKCGATSECITGTTCIEGLCIALQPKPRQRRNIPVNGGAGGTTSNEGKVAPKKEGPTKPPAQQGQEGQPQLPGSQPPPSNPPSNPEEVAIKGPIPPDVQEEKYYPSQYMGLNSISIHSPLLTDEAPYQSEGRGSTGCSGTFSVRSMDTDIKYGTEGRYSEVVDSFDSSGGFSTPYLQQEGARYCKYGGAGTGVSQDLGGLVTRPGRGVLDVISYSKMVVFLHQNGTITREQDGKRTRVKSNVKVTRLEKHGGYLYALASGLLYRLDNSTLNSNHRWQWQLCTWSPAGLVHTSSTLDGLHLWLQDGEKGYLYNQNYKLLETINMGALRRRYGYSIAEFVTFHPSQCQAQVSISGTISDHQGICNALLTREGQLIAIGRDDLENYSDVKLVNWIPYFISSNRTIQR